jgi:hypothetical protein
MKPWATGPKKEGHWKLLSGYTSRTYSLAVLVLPIVESPVQITAFTFPLQDLLNIM